MSWVRTEICCNNCNNKNIVAWQLPDRVVSVYPDKKHFAIADCQKNGGSFSITFVCKKCGKSVVKVYSKEEFNNIKFTYIE